MMLRVLRVDWMVKLRTNIRFNFFQSAQDTILAPIKRKKYNVCMRAVLNCLLSLTTYMVTLSPDSDAIAYWRNLQREYYSNKKFWIIILNTKSVIALTASLFHYYHIESDNISPLSYWQWCYLITITFSVAEIHRHPHLVGVPQVHPSSPSQWT